jgi:hypothetical protein
MTIAPDKIKNFKNEKPEKDFFVIFEIKDGRKAYYFITTDEYYKYISFYGIPDLDWSYTSNNADITVR